MGLQILDFILIGIMLVSGVLALMRGFTREVLSLVAWGLAALAAYVAIRHQPFVDYAMANVPYLGTPTLAMVAVGAVAFLVVLIVISVISVKISDMVVDSAIGGFDRTLGFVYGLARGLVLVAIAYQFYGWFLKPEQQQVWVREARSLPMIKAVGDKLRDYLPPDIAKALEQSQTSETAGAAPKSDTESGYQSNQTQGLDNLIQGTGGGATVGQAPTFGQSGGDSNGQSGQ
jgi:membrane protein required for colicin V production